MGCKPDSVVPEGTGIHLSAPLERGPREGCDIPNAFERAVPHPMLSCTGLGFQCPRRLLPRRWALTPPFHPCRSRGGLFSAALSVRAPCGARPALSDGIPLCGVRTFLPRTSRGRMPAQNSQRTPVFGIGGFGISESPARFSPKLKGCRFGLQAQSRARRKFRPDCKIGIFRPRANSPALFAQLRPNQPPPQNRKKPDGAAVRKRKFARDSGMRQESQLSRASPTPPRVSRGRKKAVFSPPSMRP